MAEIELRGLAHSYEAAPRGPEDWALRPMELTWRDGGAYALLGPSGCGKTTLLNIISGLVKPTRGQVLFDGADVTQLPPEHRNIAQVFQFPVLYDTMSVYDNLAFPLRNRGMGEPEVRSRVGQIAELLELTDDLRYRASGLSADVKQKISLGRGLVRSDVSAILFDEPLTVIDPHLKWLLRSKLKQIHDELKLTLIYVTHDQTEALTFADRVVVMFEGQVVQSGTPQELFEDPAHTFVGYFIGSPGMNLLPARMVDAGVEVGSQLIDLPSELVASARRRIDDSLNGSQDGDVFSGGGSSGGGGSGRGGDLVLGIRPEFVGYSRDGQVDGQGGGQVGEAGPAAGEGPMNAASSPRRTSDIRITDRRYTETRAAGANRSEVQAEISLIEDLGNYKIITARLGDDEIKAKIPEDQPVSLGPARLHLPHERTKLYVDGQAVPRRGTTP